MRPQWSADLAQFPRAVAVLESRAAALACERIPLLRVSAVDAPDMTSFVLNIAVTSATTNLRRRDRRHDGLVSFVRTAPLCGCLSWLNGIEFVSPFPACRITEPQHLRDQHLR